MNSQKLLKFAPVFLMLFVALGYAACSESIDTIYTIGDSITASGNYQAQLDSRMGSDSRSHNFGVGGYWCANALSMYNSSVPDGSGTTVISLCGINDVIGHANATATEHSIEAIYNLSVQKNNKLVLMTVGTATQAVQADPSLCSTIIEVNSWLATFAAAHNIPLVDFHHAIWNGTDCVSNASLTGPDGLHPNAAGNIVLGNAVWAQAFNRTRCDNAQPNCEGATVSFVCGDHVTESCTLNGNLSRNNGSCFFISGYDNPNSVIDCRGNSITGNNALYTYGVYSTMANTTVKDCAISGFYTGIYVDGSNSTVSSTAIRDFTYGVWADIDGSGTVINNVQLHSGIAGAMGFWLRGQNGTLENSLSDLADPNSFGIYVSGTGNRFINNSNQLSYFGAMPKFYAAAPQGTPSGNIGWWPLLSSDGSDATDQAHTAWYNGTAGGRNADGSGNSSLQFWADNGGRIPQAGCVGATATFSCGDVVTQSCTMNSDLTIGHTSCFTIGADDIKLDCAGHQILGTGNDGSVGDAGIGNPDGYQRLAITNCRIEGFDSGIEEAGGNSRTIDSVLTANIYDGLALVGETGATAMNITSKNNGGNGVYAEGSALELSDLRLSGNGVGLYAANVIGSTFSGIEISGSATNSLAIDGASGSVFSNFTIQGAAPSYANLHDSVFEDSSIYGDGMMGRALGISGGPGTFSNLSVSGADTCIYLSPGSAGNVVANSALSCYSYGIYVLGANDNHFYNNLINATTPAYEEDYQVARPCLHKLAAGVIDIMNRKCKQSYTYYASPNYWNSTLTNETGIMGKVAGGNYYAQPDGMGYSEVCTSVNGICDAPYGIPGESDYDYLPIAIDQLSG